jgi:hypothetical protein
MTIQTQGAVLEIIRSGAYQSIDRIGIRQVKTKVGDIWWAYGNNCNDFMDIGIDDPNDEEEQQMRRVMLRLFSFDTALSAYVTNNERAK